MLKRTPSGFSIQLVINIGFLLVFLFYLGVMILLLLAELEVPGLEWIRATNQVLILLTLLFLPFLLLASSRVIRSISVGYSGNEIRIELEDVQLKVQQVNDDLSRQVGTSEQALWTILAEQDDSSRDRWQAKKLIIGSKEDTSQVFFAYFLKEWLNRNVDDLKECELKIPNGGSLKNFADLKYCWIDLYIDFTGTCCQYFNIKHQGKALNSIIHELNQRGDNLGVRWLNPLGATEDYCLVMREEDAEHFKIKTIPELALKASNLVFTGDPEFLNRKDCFLGLRSHYGFNFKRIEPCHVTERYAMIEAKEPVVFVGYETDLELQPGSGLIKLQDIDQFFPSYDAIPVIQTKACDYIDGLEVQLSRLHNAMTTQDLIMQVQRLSSHDVDPQTTVQEFCNRIADRIQQIEAIEHQFEQRLSTDSEATLAEYIQEKVNIRENSPAIARNLTEKLQAKLINRLESNNQTNLNLS